MKAIKTFPLSVTGLIIGLLVGYLFITVGWHRYYPTEKYQNYVHQTTMCTKSNIYWERRGFPIYHSLAGADGCKLLDERKYAFQPFFDLTNFASGFVLGYAGYWLVNRRKAKK